MLTSTYESVTTNVPKISAIGTLRFGFSASFVTKLA